MHIMRRLPQVTEKRRKIRRTKNTYKLRLYTVLFPALYAILRKDVSVVTYFVGF